ncbi:ComEC/Rec2 family competence protein [Oceanobacillus sp. FSL H7-0719]|uniref:ComEC/Rec2 family competence protein n=1 Tax=Oceanobacillus sp. FSL H7-0719 TaxID=2954507 RepID=UPI003249E366
MKKFLLFLILLYAFPIYTTAEANDLMRVHFIDVGQGDSILIQTPERQNILIDGGEPDAGPRLIRYLEENNIDEIDLLIATHPDIDHIGGLNEILKTVPVKKIIDNGQQHFTRTYAMYRMLILKETIPVKIAKEDEHISFEEDLDIHVLNAAGEKKNNNESSIVLKVAYNEIDFLLMSDVEAKQEKEMADKYDIRSEILKVAHHGSSSSSSLGFLKKVEPEAAIITYSKENNYGHPVQRVIKNLNKLNAQIFSTAVYGNVIIETDGEDYIILPEFHPMDKLIKRLP